MVHIEALTLSPPHIAVPLCDHTYRYTCINRWQIYVLSDHAHYYVYFFNWLTSYCRHVAHLLFLAVGLQICAVMADSHFDKLNCDKINDICSCSNRLQAFLRLHNVLFNLSGQCYRCCDGRMQMQLRQEKSLIADGQMWRCANRKCRATAKNSIRKHSFFAGSHLSLATITKLVYYWIHKFFSTN